MMFLNKIFCLIFLNLKIPSIKPELAGLLEGHGLVFPPRSKDRHYQAGKNGLLTLSTFMI